MLVKNDLLEKLSKKQIARFEKLDKDFADQVERHLFKLDMLDLFQGNAQMIRFISDLWERNLCTTVCKKCSCYYGGNCRLSAGQKNNCLENNYSNYETYQCINESCNWEGKKMECSFFKHDTWHKRPLCPECHEIVEKNTKH